MSDTPRTDGMTFVAQIGMMPPYDTVPAEFARQLERELNAVKAESEAIREALQSIHLDDIFDVTMREIAKETLAKLK